MKLDVIDLYYLHWPDPETPIEGNSWRWRISSAMGLFAFIGLSNVSGEQIRRAFTVHAVAAIQVEW